MKTSLSFDPILELALKMSHQSNVLTFKVLLTFNGLLIEGHISTEANYLKNLYRATLKLDPYDLLKGMSNYNVAENLLERL